MTQVQAQVQQWLAEIKGLQQKLLEVQQEREQAYASAANWRNLYEIEAKQRRAEAQTSQAAIAALQAELTAYQSPDPQAEGYSAIVQQQVDRWQTPEELKSQLMQSLIERDRLLQALESEQQAHRQTRQDLTTALGDTMDLLSKTRSDLHSELHRGQRTPAESGVVVPISAASRHASDSSPERP